MKESFLILGGDKRQEYLKNILSEKFENVFHIMSTADLNELDNMAGYTHIILPVPTSKDNETVYCRNKDMILPLKDMYGRLTEKHKVFGCYLKLNESITVFDLMKDETFVLANACLTAQGAVRLLLENTEEYIVGKKVLITGFGNVAETLADKLSKLGLEVYIAARNKNQLLKASFCGYKTLKLSSISSCIFIFDYIFGTTPANVLESDDVKSINDRCVYFELASLPFSAKKEHFTLHNKKFISGSALPGRFLPEASAKLIADFILMNL